MSARVGNNGEQGFVFEDWLAEGIKGLGAKRRELRRKLIPEGFRTHLKASKKELLLALRSLLDEAIARTEEAPEKPKRATKINVE